MFAFHIAPKKREKDSGDTTYMSTPTIAVPKATAPSPTATAQVPSERTQEDLELAARLIEHSQGGRVNSREQAASTSSQPASTASQAEPRRSPISTDGEGSRSRSTGGDADVDVDMDADDQARSSDDGLGNQNLSLPSIHELTWVKQRKPFNTGLGGAGQVCRYVNYLALMLRSCPARLKLRLTSTAIAALHALLSGGVHQRATLSAMLADCTSRRGIRCGR